MSPAAVPSSVSDVAAGPAVPIGVGDTRAETPADAVQPLASRQHVQGDFQKGGGQNSAPSAEYLSLIPYEFARRHLILSGGYDEARRTERLLVAASTQPSAVHNVGVRLRRAVERAVGDSEHIAAEIDRVYREAADRAASAQSTRSQDGPVVAVEGSKDLESDLVAAVRAAQDAERDLLNTHDKAPSVRLVDLVLFEALLRSASDVHIQPLRDRTLVRYRLDGALHTVRELPAGLASSVVSRVKVMSRLDVAEQRAPQDGRTTVSIGAAAGGTGGRRIDLRVSTLPSTYGERVVIRLLDPTRSPHLQTFSGLGMPLRTQERYLEQVARTSGIVLSTGPTGSGKTTTLYATLAWISAVNSPTDRGAASANLARGSGRAGKGCELNIMTVEDPVEYDLSAAGLAISQTQVDPKKNVTFAAGLRHILRQDPDVIMVGEIRDQETARIAIQSALTGHLVLSTLHTNDAASAVARLLDLGIEPYLVSSSLAAVLAQRLVRTVHTACSGEGCPECLRTGFKGRRGVFELLVMDGEIRQLVERRAAAAEVKETAQRLGMETLREAGVALVRAGLTTAAEVGRVVEVVRAEDMGDADGVLEGRAAR